VNCCTRPPSEIFGKLSMIEGQISDSQTTPRRTDAHHGCRIHRLHLASPASWQTARHEHPDIQLTVLLDDRILNLECAKPMQPFASTSPNSPDLIQRQSDDAAHLPSLRQQDLSRKKMAKPDDIKDLRNHTLIGLPRKHPQRLYADPNWLFRLAGVDPEQHNNLIMMNSVYAIQSGCGEQCGHSPCPAAVHDSWQSRTSSRSSRELQNGPALTCISFTPRNAATPKRLAIFRDFLLENLPDEDF
jgi:hypothetical protein